jgi:kumamolisin
MTLKNQQNQRDTNAKREEKGQQGTNAPLEADAKGGTDVRQGGNAKGGGSASHVVLWGSTRMLRPGARVLGVAGPEEWVEILVKIRRRKPLPEVSGRPAERLTREQLEADYGADPADMAAVRSVLTGYGLSVLKEDLISCSLRAGGAADQIESAFSVKLFHYSHESGNYRGRKGEVHIPAELEGIITGVFGLDNRKLVKRRPLRRKVISLDEASRAAAARSWFYPAELAAIYGFPDGDGKGQTVGILEFGGGYFADDLATFCKDAGITAPSVKTVSINNTPVNQRDGAEGEVMLDVEVIAGVCPAAAIIVYFSTFDESGWVSAIDTAVHDKANPLTVLSVSWGYAEDAQGGWSAGAIDAINDTMKAAALLGVTICVAAGDDGSDDQAGDGHAHVDFPSSSPFVLSVGGTTLRKNTNGSVTETAWKDGDGLRRDNGGSTGGGISVHFARPDWQTVKITSVNPGSIDGRVVPDVAADASANTGYWTVVDGEGGASGGTSASAPLWAALIARINGGLGSGVTLGFLTPLLYQKAGNGSPLGSTGCRDITSGNNNTASIGGYSAGPGYDAVTGWGVPQGAALLDGLKKLLPQ